MCSCWLWRRYSLGPRNAPYLYDQGQQGNGSSLLEAGRSDIYQQHEWWVTWKQVLPQGPPTGTPACPLLHFLLGDPEQRDQPCSSLCLTYRAMRTCARGTSWTWVGETCEAANLGFNRPTAVFCYWTQSPSSPRSSHPGTWPIGDWKYF